MRINTFSAKVQQPFVKYEETDDSSSYLKDGRIKIWLETKLDEHFKKKYICRSSVLIEFQNFR